MHDSTAALLADRRHDFELQLPIEPISWAVDLGWSKEVLPLTTVDSLLRQGSFHTPLLELVKEGHLIPPSKFTLGTDIWSRNTVDLNKVNAQLEGGATMVLNLLHELDVNAATIARGLQDDFGTSVTVTAFYTPANTHGFNFHYDSYGAFLLQLEGAKKWRVAPPPIANPLETQRWNPALASAEMISAWESGTEIVLRAGEALWLPRGWMHGGQTEANPSWHVTFGLAEHSYIRILRNLLSIAEIELEEMRQDIFGGWAHQVDVNASADVAVEGLLDWIAKFDRSELAAVAASEYQSRFFQPTPPLSIAKFD